MCLSLPLFPSPNITPLLYKNVSGVNCPWLDSDIKSTIRQREYSICLKKHEKQRAMRIGQTIVALGTALLTKSKELREHIIDVYWRITDYNKAFWRTVKKIIPGESKEVSPNIKIGENFCSDKRTIATAFNKYFVGAVARLLDSVGASVVSVCREFTVRPFNPAQRRPFQFKEVPENFTLTQLRKTGKAVCLDNIQPRLLRDSADIVTRPLTIIINASLRQGKVPNDWKAARVIPII